MPPLGSDTDDLRNTLLRVAGLSAADDEASDLERAEAEALRPVLWTVLSRFGQQIQRQNQRMRVSQFDLLGAPPHRVVFLGSSITEGGRWDEWFPELPTRNRGVGGDTIDDVAARLDSALNQPLKINLLIGANDLRDLVEPTGVDDIAARMERLIARIRTTVPQAPLYLNSVMPRAQVYATNVRALNRHYARIADRAGATYVDLWSALAGPDGALRPEFTLDELHLTGAGYRAWVEVLRPHLG